MSDPADVDTVTGPYAATAHAYHRAGWSPLPLPPRAKKPVPAGWTGRAGNTPSGADVQAWTEDYPDGNIALRLPVDVIGFDVDAYGDKAGALVLGALEQQLGPLPPTWRSTSRDDGTSGIRLYVVPPGMKWPGILGPGIEVIRFEHRYAVVWPSVHPDTGGTYRWIDPAGNPVIGDIPRATDLPDLPAKWLEHFTGGELDDDHAKAGLDARALGAWAKRLADGPMCNVVRYAADDGIADIAFPATAGSRHESGLRVVSRLVWLGAEGHRGVRTALDEVGRAFVAAVSPERRDAAAEWDRMLSGAVDLAAATHAAPMTDDPCADRLRDVRDIIGPDGREVSTTLPAYAETMVTGLTTTPAPATPDGAEGAPFTQFTPDRAQEVEARLRDGASFILDIPERIPAVWGRDDEVLWAEGEALTIAGPPGVGKTTLVGQVVRARMVGGDVLGLPVTPTTGRVLYLAMDRPRQIARALRRTLGDLPRHVLEEHLVVWPGPPLADVAQHPATLLALVRAAGADTVIVDSIKDAAVGLSSDEAGAGYNRARQYCIADGIQIAELHHMVKRGDNGAPPTSLQDMYGSVWIGAGSGSVVLLHGAAGDPIVTMRHLKTPAEEVGPWSLVHDHAAGTTEIYHEADVVAMVRAAGRRGVSAREVAQAIEEKENPGKGAIEKARRRLDKLVDAGMLVRTGGARGGAAGAGAARWHLAGDGIIAPPVVEDTFEDDDDDPTDRGVGW